MLLHVTDPNPSHSLRRARIFEGDGSVEGAAFSYWPEKRFYWREIPGLWSVAVELDDEFDDEPRSTRDLIERQRKLGESPRPLDHLYAVAVGGALSDRLNELSDRQIGQLLFDFCWPELYVDGPELIIVTQAIDRLRRSTGGGIPNEEAQDNLKQQPVCPKCGNEMFLHYGIDEPDFWLCDRVSCRHKRYVGGPVRIR